MESQPQQGLAELQSEIAPQNQPSSARQVPPVPVRSDTAAALLAIVRLLPDRHSFRADIIQSAARHLNLSELEFKVESAQSELETA